MRVLIAVTHLLGVGHLARAAALGRAFVQAGHVVRLISGGRPALAIDLAGLEVVQLPSVHVLGTDFQTLYRADGAVADASYLAGREAALVASAAAFQPDAVIIELFPFGRRQLRAEFLALVAAARAQGAALLCSVRDVPTPPSTQAKVEQSHDWLGLFDGVLVHSDPKILPFEASWPATPAVLSRLSYTGYVGEARQSAPAKRAGIVVSGGGSATALPLMRAALAVAAGDARAWRVLVGHALPEAEFAALKASAPANASVERARADFPALLAAAECSISQFGYNTALDLVAAGTPAVVVPYDEGKEVEQTIRATRFAALGLVENLPMAEVTPDTLRAAVDRAIARGPGTITIDRNGAERSVALVAEAVLRKQGEARGWQRLIAALDGAVREGRLLRFWWRDDDATEATPALERLLRLRGDFGVPLALAVIPGRAGAALAGRLAREPDVTVLVHGLDHQNRAPANGKKSEFPAGGDATRAALAQALARITTLFGLQALPVFVPPWNRMAAEVANDLVAAGYAGWSGYDDRAPPQDSPGERWLGHWRHTHVDIMDWNRGGLLPVTAILDRIALWAEQGKDVRIGILTHHLVHDPWAWAFLAELFGRLANHPAVRFVPASEVFALTSPFSGGRQGG
jgi:predicted glycosyltransferase